METNENNHEEPNQRVLIAHRSARRRAWLRLWALAFAGLGVAGISMVIPIWGSIRYLVYLDIEDVPEIRLLLGFLMLPVGVGLLGMAWWLDRRSRQREKFREAFRQDLLTRDRARRRLVRGGGNGD